MKMRTRTVWHVYYSDGSFAGWGDCPKWAAQVHPLSTVKPVRIRTNTLSRYCTNCQHNHA